MRTVSGLLFAEHYRQVKRHWRVTCVMAAGRETPVGARSGVTFDVKIDIP